MKSTEKILAQAKDYLEAAAKEKLEQFCAADPTTANFLTQLAIRDAKLSKVVEMLWIKGYVNGFTDAVQAAFEDSHN